MKSAVLVSLLTVASAAPQFQVPYPPTTGGTGPYAATYFIDPSLPNHVVYQPKATSGLKIPVVVWGNGGCAPAGTLFQAFLAQVASYGVMLIAPGGLEINWAAPATTAKDMIESLDWITRVAGTGNYSHVDATRVAAWGQSCGGLEVLANAQDSRIGSLGIFNSGQFTEADSKAVASKINKPVFYFLGGSTDIAYANGERDYKYLPTGTPAWKGNNGKGHENTFTEANAGKVGMGGVYLAQWLLRGNSTAGQWFTSDGAKADGYTDVVSQNLDKIKVSPI